MKKNLKKLGTYSLAFMLMISTFSLNVRAEKYEYDSFDRVTKVIYDDGSYVTYTYDNNGNITNTEVETRAFWSAVKSLYALFASSILSLHA